MGSCIVYYHCQEGRPERQINTGQEVTEMEQDKMTTKEIIRLIDWLVARGNTVEEGIQCIKYIAGEPDPKEEK